MAQFTRNLAPSTRMAIQAAVAVTIAILFGHFFQLERSYWAILTAMVLVSQTWGESIRKSVTRILMTAAGGVSGTLIYVLFKNCDYLLFAFLLTCLFFVVYFLETAYLWVVFFLTNLVVFLFALLQNWNTELLLVRIEETFIGTLIAIITSALVLPTRAKTQLTTELPQFLKLAAELTDNCLTQFFKKKRINPLLKKRRTRLLKAYAGIDNYVKTSGYEIFFSSRTQAQLKCLSLELNVLIHYIICLVETLPYLTHTTSYQIVEEELHTIKQIIDTNFTALIYHYQDQTSKSELKTLDIPAYAIFQKINANIEHNPASKEEWLEFYSFFYFLRRVNECLLNLAK